MISGSNSIIIKIEIVSNLKIKKMRTMKWLSIIMLFIPFAVTAQNSYDCAKFEMSISGTSSLHDWVSSVGQFEAFAQVVSDSENLRIQSLVVGIPVASIKSTKGSIMDKKTYKALDMENHPHIKFVLTDPLDVANYGQNLELMATGELRIAGALKKVDLKVEYTVTPNGEIMFSGSKKLKMTDFKIAPPKAMFGTLKTGDDIEIKFSITLTNNNI
jgi:polyisoprenoid-binding protein YceI